ncbi:hypothetical protein ACU8KH_03974 [Lachancea thermotolerans]
MNTASKLTHPHSRRYVVVQGPLAALSHGNSGLWFSSAMVIMVPAYLHSCFGIESREATVASGKHKQKQTIKL